MSELLYRLDQSTDYKRECLSDTRHEIDGFFDVVPEELMTRAEWEASIESVVTVNPNSDNTFGWMEHVKGSYVTVDRQAIRDTLIENDGMGYDVTTDRIMELFEEDS